MAVDVAGDLFIADTCNSVVRKVNSAGMISTVAGNGTPGYSGDGGAATTAELDYPAGVAVDAAGNLFIADTGNNVVREAGATGTITTVAGSGTCGYGGDGGPATAARMNGPEGIAIDQAGRLFIADSGNNLIRSVETPLYWDPRQTATETAGGSGTWTSSGNNKCWYDPLMDVDVAWADGCSVVFAGSNT